MFVHLRRLIILIGRFFFSLSLVMNSSSDVWKGQMEPFEDQLFARGEVLLGTDEVCKYAFYVVSGCLKSYVIDAKGKEHILQFAPEGWLISEMNSLVNKVPSSYCIEAIEPTVVKMVNAEKILNSPFEEPSSAVRQIQVLQNRIIALNKRILHLLSSSAEDRYLDFVKTYPGLIHRLTQKQIASYLGITPESLSRIRRKLSDNEKPTSK